MLSVAEHRQNKMELNTIMFAFYTVLLANCKRFAKIKFCLWEKRAES